MISVLQIADLLPAAFAPGLPLAVGYSGGADSTALLLAARARWPGRVLAIHVNHGLQAAAVDFEAHCIATCQRLKLPLIVTRLRMDIARGQSPEDAARRARWQALTAAMAQVRAAKSASGGPFEPLSSDLTLSSTLFKCLSPSPIVFSSCIATNNVATDWTNLRDLALAQHADDQAETVLLALSRGAGLGGLSGMPVRAERDGIALHRPLLSVRRSAIEAALQQAGERWVDDPTNASADFTRNRIRNQALPAIEAALPGFAPLAARSAAHLAQAQRLLQELAESDLLTTGLPPRVRALQALNPDRQANALRHWLCSQGTQASAAQLAELQRQVSACNTRGHQLRLKVGAGYVSAERTAPGDGKEAVLRYTPLNDG